MRRAIDRLDAADGGRLSLDQIAAEMHLSPAHFQRVFTRFAGVSPKRYQQYLALGHARRLLTDRFTTLDTAAAVGLSGSSRLHDLFVTWEAMSPGDYARRGTGRTIHWGRFDSPFGGMLVMTTERGICGLAFTDETGEEAAFADLAARWPGATFIADPGAVAPVAARVLGPRGTAFRQPDGEEASDAGTGTQRQDAPLRLHVAGAPFQIKVWEALMRIPSGRVTTYGEIARAIGSPRAVRAVGTAVGRNPVSWLIPCHRALRKSGGLGGYHWGLPVKRVLLAQESAETGL
ncbi:methylated-DNA--[protein]-cysteine S-methyltransferase [Mesobaculum littorinae]|uniref:methylated-DNA--[protein]-cysteine S-methyltransferase n=1 Tax=Mesobaculum littorinae TaxID=2486419 RepID=A0A438AEP9_9RHOB|nr:bifunctional helix-turn-helix domain-containing protein/methylated-DNA--[protein]-cysteine S-methyltransferase [Mesobaculum littorinae]RVV97147.1 methylated-DNA--[protein]-cysteine S-methyltransferase [Mesobaculum littorinae]